MQDRYSLTIPQARACRLAAAFLWFAAAVAALSLPVFWAEIGGEIALACDAERGCGIAVDRAAMLPDDLAAAVRASAEASAAFEGAIREPGLRAVLALLVTVRILPHILLFAFAAAAVWRLGTRREQALAAALPWLRRAAFAALAVALVPPAVDAVRGGVLAGRVAGDGFRFALDVDIVALGINLMLALTALSVSWALEAGTRATRDADGFV